MKKYTLILFILIFALGFLGLFNFNANSASAVNCASGDLFNTVTGLPCSGTTGTGRKLSCVNLSSSIYCSNTSDTLVTAVPPTPLPPVLPPNPPPAGSSTAGSCSLTSAKEFGRGQAPGSNTPVVFSQAGYENDVSISTTSSGVKRLLLFMNYGFEVESLSNPSNPTTLFFENMINDITPRGDGQNYISAMGTSADGKRAVFTLGPQAGSWGAAIMSSPASFSGDSFRIVGDSGALRGGGGVVVQKTSDGRYIAYSLAFNRLTAADITTVTGGHWDRVAGAWVGLVGNTPSEGSVFPSGYNLQLVGNYLTYLGTTSGGTAVSGVQILDVSNPGSTKGSITTGFTQTKLSAADFGRSSDSMVSLSTALDPADSSALYVLVAFMRSPTYNPIPTGYSLMRVKGSTKTILGSFAIPSLPGEKWMPASSALITAGNNVYAFMWARREDPTGFGLYRLFTTTVSNFGATPPRAIDFDPTDPQYSFSALGGQWSSFAVGRPMRGFGSADGKNVYAYMATGQSAYALTFACSSGGGPSPAPTPPPPPPPPPPTPPSVASSCTLSGSPVMFEPSPPGLPRPVGQPEGDLSIAFTLNSALYRNGAGGPPRLLMEESWGYSVLDLSNPLNPTAIRYDDLTRAGYNPNVVYKGGDGQSYIQTVAASPDGQRVAFSTTGPADPPWSTIVGRPDGNNGFGIWGDVPQSRAAGTVIQQVGSRYIVYSLHGGVTGTATDVTTLPSSLQPLPIDQSVNPLPYEKTNWPPGNAISLAGDFVIYIARNFSYGTEAPAIHLVDVSNPGPVGNITSAFKQTEFNGTQVLNKAGQPDASFTGRRMMWANGHVDPTNPKKLWLIIELSGPTGNPMPGEHSPSFGLVSITEDSNGNFQAPVSAGPVFRVPALAGETWQIVGPAHAIVAKNGNLFVLMWAHNNLTSKWVLYSTTVSNWGKVTPFAQPFDYPLFGVGQFGAVLDGPGNTIYYYSPGGASWVTPLSCGTSTTSYTPPPLPPTPPPPPPPSPPPAPYSCITGASLGLPACINGCYVPQPGPSGGAPSDYYKCVPNGSFTLLLKLGSTGSEVVALQNFLNAAGYYTDVIDGNFGPKTQAAVIKFQIANGLVGDGVVGALTRAVLNRGNVSATPACTLNISYNPTTVPYNGSLTVSYSGTNVDNSTVQYNFDNKGYAPLSPFPDSKVQSNLTSVGTHNIILQGKNSAGVTCYSNTPSYTVSPVTSGTCLYSTPAGLPACANGCYVPQPGPSGGAPSDYWKCVPN